MEILYVTAEAVPFRGDSDAGALGRALPKTLRELGHKVTVLAPLYKSVDAGALSLARRLTGLTVSIRDGETRCELYDGRTPAGVDLVFVGHETLFRGADALTDGEPEVVAERLSVYAKAVAAFARGREPRVAVVHAHDAAGAAVVLALRRENSVDDIATVLTVTAAEARLVLPATCAGAFGFTEEQIAEAAMVQAGELDVLRGGLMFADHVTTVSAGYAQELCQLADDATTSAAFARLGQRLSGIPLGVDSATFSPATDPRLPTRFDPMALAGKASCKSALQNELELPLRSEVALFGCRLDEGSTYGGDLFAKALPGMLRNDVQVVTMVDRPCELSHALSDLAERFADRLIVRTTDDEGFFHRLLGASDVLVDASRRAPSGMRAMFAQRYGALPLVRRTGGFVDAVVDCDASLTTGTGFVFDEDDAPALLAAAQRAVAGFARTEAFDALRRRVMRMDRSWERTARLYDRLYRELQRA